MRRLAALLALTCHLGTVPLYSSSGRITLTLHIETEQQEEVSVSVNAVNLTDSVKSETSAEENSVSLQLERGDEYLISLDSLPDGMMPSEEIFLSSEETRADLERTITLRPFAVRIYQHISEMEVFAPGGKLELRNEQDETVAVFEPDPQGFVRDEEGNEILLKAGSTYLLSQTEAAPGYEQAQEMLVEIPSFMENNEQPLEFFVPLKELSGYEFKPSESSDVYWPIHLPQDPFSQETEDISAEEEEPQESTEPAAPVYSTPAVYVTHTFSAPQNEKKTASAAEKYQSGFMIRMTTMDHRTLSGASLAVYDSQGNPVDAWISTDEDHLVSGEKVKEGETYTVKLIKAAQGYAGDTVPVEHTAVRVADSRWPLIEISDRPKAAETRTEPQKKIRKTADSLVIAACAVSALAIGLVIAAAARQSPAK